MRVARLCSGRSRCRAGVDTLQHQLGDVALAGDRSNAATTIATISGGRAFRW